MSIQLIDLNNKIIPVEFIEFSGGERHVQIASSHLSSLPKTLKIKAKISNSADLMDYLLLESVLLDQGIQIDVEIPYFPYARQDRRCAPGQAFSLNMMTRLLNLNPAQTHQRKSITVWDAHSHVTTELLRNNTQYQTVTNIGADQIILSDAKLTQILSANDCVLICPDAGAIKRTEMIAAAIRPHRENAIEIVYCEKKRDPMTGRIVATQVNHNDLSGCTAVITDDICDGGATFIAIAKALKDLQCTHIILYVTHGIFSRGIDVFDGLIDQIFCSSSFEVTESSKLSIIPFNNNNSDVSEGISV